LLVFIDLIIQNQSSNDRYLRDQKLVYKKKQWRPPSKKEERRGKKKKKSKSEEQEGMPQHQHCPPEKRRGDKNERYFIYPRARFAKDVSLLTIWPKDHHRLGLGED
jgi:hypothetical protein